MKKDNPDLIVAKMDATANDVHPVFGLIKGYPTIFFLPAGQKEEPIQFQGSEFTYKALKEFVDQQSSVFLTEEERMGLPSPNSVDEESSESQQREIDEL